MSQYETTSITPGEQQTGLTTEESYDHIDPNSPNYQGDQKKPSILGKIKDKTRKAGSKIKSKVGKKKDADGIPANPTGAGGEEEDEEEDTSDDSPSPSPADAASPVINTTPYTGPASVPREFGTYPSRGKSNLGESESKETGSTPPDMSGLSLNDSTPDSKSATDKASEGAKGAIYGGAAATAGAFGYDAMSKDDHPDEKPVSEKASDASSDVAGKAEEFGRGGYNRAGDAKDTVAEMGRGGYNRAGDAEDTVAEKGRGGYNRAGDAKDTVAEKGSEVADQTKDAAYGTKDAAQSKAADVNNATDDSETYTQKASNTAVAAKDTVADKLGMNQPSEGPSMVDKAKGYFGSAVDTTKDKTGMNQPSEGPSMMDKAKGYFGSTVDTTKDKTSSGADTTKDYATTAKDTTKDYAGSAYDNTASAAQGATDTTKDYTTRAKDAAADAATPKDEHKALSEKITETLGGVTAPANTPTGGVSGEANPGILGKLTGMLGYAQKGPEDHPHDTGVHPSDTTTTTATQ